MSFFTDLLKRNMEDQTERQEAFATRVNREAADAKALHEEWTLPIKQDKYWQTRKYTGTNAHGKNSLHAMEGGPHYNAHTQLNGLPGHRANCWSSAVAYADEMIALKKENEA